MILSNTKTGAWIPVQSEAEGHSAARSKGWTDYQIEPRHPATTIGE
ncbi:hypothetical protein ACFSDD_11210 [Salipiger marinus]|nr:hypothetical protein [Salipiger manganoxidans]MEB3419940.1 hypothetical protein [Salipiger manganoxidans]